MKWVVDRIRVCAPIRFTNIRRNEVKDTISARKAQTVMEKGGELYQRVKTTYKSITAIYKASLTSDGDGDGNGVHAGAESSRSAFDEDGQNQGNPEE